MKLEMIVVKLPAPDSFSLTLATSPAVLYVYWITELSGFVTVS